MAQSITEERIAILERERTQVARRYHKSQRAVDLERLADIDDELEKLRHELTHPVHITPEKEVHSFDIGEE